MVLVPFGVPFLTVMTPFFEMLRYFDPPFFVKVNVPAAPLMLKAFALLIVCAFFLTAAAFTDGVRTDTRNDCEIFVGVGTGSGVGAGSGVGTGVGVEGCSASAAFRNSAGKADSG